MAKFNDLSMEFSGFNEMVKKLNQLDANVKAITEEALRETHRIVTEKAEIATRDPNLPAGGEYGSGDTHDSLEHNAKITWKGTEASVEVGFHISKGGLPSIFMIKGTPSRMKNVMLYEAFYGADTKAEYTQAQREIFEKALEQVMK